METTGSIYVIKNSVNSKVYVGQTTQPVVKRFKQHLKLLKANQKQLISKAIAKYGGNCFYCEVLENEVPLDKLDEREQELIKKFDSLNNGYNLCPGGQKWRKQPLELPYAEIIAVYQTGLSTRSIATAYKVSPTLIQEIVKKHGLSRPKHHNLPDRGSKVCKETLSELYFVQKMTQKEIAVRLGVHERTIERSVKRHCLQRT